MESEVQKMLLYQVSVQMRVDQWRLDIFTLVPEAPIESEPLKFTTNYHFL